MEYQGQGGMFWLLAYIYHIGVKVARRPKFGGMRAGFLAEFLYSMAVWR